MEKKTEYAGLNKIGTYLDEDLPKINENTEITDAQFKQAAQERQAEAQTRAEADAALALGLENEANTRHSEDIKLLQFMTDESLARKEAAAAHDASDSAHDALVSRITMGSLSPVIGICHAAVGNYTGLWCHVDENGQPVSPPPMYFDFHPVYSGLRRVLVDGQVMVEIPVFYIKHLTPASGPCAGRPCKIISPTPRDGFKPYPAFISTSGAVLEKIYVGAFQGTDEGSSKVGSRPGKMPIVNLTIDVMRQRCENRNTGGVSGFHLWNIYEYNAICLLFLIEHATTESQAVMGRGWVDSTAAVTTDDQYQPYWRGFTGLFGNVWQFVDGLRLKGNREIEIFRADGSRTYGSTGKLAPSNDANVNYVTAFHTGEIDGVCLDDCFVPSGQTTDPAAATLPDRFWGGSGTAGNILIIGGTWNDSGGAGLFCLYLGNTVSSAWASGGCRSAKH